jgi:hypothetical protein
VKGITFDIKYWAGLKGDSPARIEQVHGDDFIEKLKELLSDPTVQGVQVTIEKSHGGEFM